MAQINFSAEEQLNMNKEELDKAHKILIDYSKKTDSAASKNRWQAAAKKIQETSKTLDTVIAEAEHAGIKFEEGEKSILTIAEVGKRMRAHKNQNGKSYEMDEDALGVEDIALSNTLGDKARDLMNDPNASQKISTGILGFAAAEFAFSALGMGGALGAGQSLLTSVLPLIGDGIAALWGCSPIGVMALGIGVFIKAYPFLKKLKAKFTQQQTRDLQSDLESIRQGGGSEKKSSIFKEVENKKEEDSAKAEPDANAKAKAEAEAKAQAGSDAKAKAEAEAKAKAEAEAKAKAEAEAKAKAEAEAKAKAEADNKKQPEQDKELDAVLEALGVQSGDAENFKEAVEAIRTQMAEASKISTTLTESLPEKDDTDTFLYVGQRPSTDPEGHYFMDTETGIQYIDPEHTVTAEMNLEDCKKQKEEVNRPLAEKNQTISELVQSSNEASRTLGAIQQAFAGTNLESVISKYITALSIEFNSSLNAIKKNQADADKEFELFNQQIDKTISELEQELNNAAEQEQDKEPVVEDDTTGDGNDDNKEEEKEEEIETKIENLPPTVAQRLKGVGDKVLGYLTSEKAVSGHKNQYKNAGDVKKAMEDPEYIAKDILGMSQEEYDEFTASDNGGLVTDMLSAYLQVKSKPNAKGKNAVHSASKVAEAAVKAAEEVEAAAQQAGE